MKLTSFKYKTRKGPDYRHGEQMSFLDIKHTFGLGNIRVGSWVNKEEKALAANLVFDALADLAYILALPPEAIGLRGTLNLAFGAGGQQGVQAHYAPHLRELALAKNAGAGALAHEFWHAFDHYIADKAFDLNLSPHPNHRSLFATDYWLKNTPPISHTLNERLFNVFDVMLLSDNKQDKNDFVSRSVIADKALSRHYFSMPTEITARAFEAAIESCAEINNPYLVSGTTKTKHASVYPEHLHRHAIFNALQAYFKPLGMALTR